ncbi:MAG: zinc metalloprotease HtpX [Firmicutes bacterium]|nr:zinc metalloprotease HtpX [Bacillota bacterium]
MAKKRAWYGRDNGLSIRMTVTMFLLAVLYLAFMVVLYELRMGIPILVVIILALLVSQLLFSDRLVLLATKARLVDARQAPRLFTIVERLAQLADIPMPKLAVMPIRMPNAFTTGRSPKSAVITVTQGLLDRLNDQELEGVLAHEVTHIKNRDVIVITYASFFAMIASIIVQQFFLFGLMAEEDRGRGRNGGQMIMFVWLASLAVWAISYILIRVLSRYREYAADRGSAILTGHPGYLVSALTKIDHSVKQSPSRDLRQAESFNAFFIMPAIRRDSMMEIFSTHPDIQHRLRYLEHVQQEMNKAK